MRCTLWLALQNVRLRKRWRDMVLSARQSLSVSNDYPSWSAASVSEQTVPSSALPIQPLDPLEGRLEATSCWERKPSLELTLMLEVRLQVPEGERQGDMETSVWNVRVLLRVQRHDVSFSGAIGLMDRP